MDPSTSLPSIVLVKFDGYMGPPFPGCDESVVPILPVYRPYDYKGASCTRTQFPLRLSYAITVHKSQGLTLPKVVLNLNQKEHAAGLSYVAVSRVKTLDSLLFEEPFDHDRFTGGKSLTYKERVADFDRRTGQLV